MDEKQDRFEQDQVRSVAAWARLTHALNVFAYECAEAVRVIQESLDGEERKNG